MDTRELNLKPLSQEDLDELDRLRDSHPRLWQYIRELVQAVSVLASELQALLSERDALRAENERLRDALREHQTKAVELVNELLWAMDIMDMYERRLLQFGDAKELVHSAVHVDRKFRARDLLEYCWQMLNEGSRCHPCKDGNIPLNGWHKFFNGEQEPCKAVERESTQPAPDQKGKL
jgi:regulator of replication initiation timing